MIILLSPSKTMDFNSPTHITNGNDPLFIKDSVKLVKILQKEGIQNLMELMNISYNLAELNYYRFKEWNYPYISNKVKPALAAYTGDVYEGLKAWELSSAQIEFADKHVRILSGLYGVLRPTDLIMPYRLEMGIKLSGNGFTNLYDFWQKKLTNQIKKEFPLKSKKIVVNLASEEYARVVNFEKLSVQVITPFFKEFRNGHLKFITFNGKKARGLMTKFIIVNNITNFEELKLFNYEGYSFNDQESDINRWIFSR